MLFFCCWQAAEKKTPEMGQLLCHYNDIIFLLHIVQSTVSDLLKGQQSAGVGVKIVPSYFVTILISK
jgi:hypothetical protein